MLERGCRWFGCMPNEFPSIMPLIVGRRESVGETDFGLGWLVRVIWVESSVLGSGCGFTSIRSSVDFFV